MNRDAKAELMAALAENLKRRKQTPIDDAKFFRRLKNEYNMSVKEIALAVFGDDAKRKNKDQLVQQRLSLLRLTAEEQERVHNDELGVVAALDMLKKREADKEDADG